MHQLMLRPKRLAKDQFRQNNKSGFAVTFGRRLVKKNLTCHTQEPLQEPRNKPGSHARKSARAESFPRALFILSDLPLRELEGSISHGDSV